MKIIYYQTHRNHRYRKTPTRERSHRDINDSLETQLGSHQLEAAGLSRVETPTSLDQRSQGRNLLTNVPKAEVFLRLNIFQGMGLKDLKVEQTAHDYAGNILSNTYAIYGRWSGSAHTQ